MSRLDSDSLAMAGEYVLGVLEARDREAAERRLSADADFRAAVTDWRERLLELDATAEPITPSPQLWHRIETALDALQPEVRPDLRQRAGLWNSLRFWRLGGLASAAACLVLAIGLVVLSGRPAPAPVVIAVLEAQDSTPGAIVEAYADGSIRLVPLTDIPVPPGRALQVWTLWDRERGPVPLGLLDSARRAVLNVEGQPVPRPQQLYEITLEPDTGSPTGRPTGPILYKGLAAAPR
ncbi:MAG: anti-sigma factor [Reyranellaceae bacterium]